MRAIYNMTPDIPGAVKRFATLEEKHEDYGPWASAYEGVYVHLKKWLEENEYEMIGRDINSDHRNDRRFLIRDLSKEREGYIEYWRHDKDWVFWMVFE